MPQKKKKGPARPKTAKTASTEPVGALMATLNQGLMSLYHSSAELQFSKPLPSLLKSILRGLKNGTGIQKAIILVKDGSDGSLKGSVCIGLNEEKIGDLSISLTPEEDSGLLSPLPADGTGARPVHGRLAAHLSEAGLGKAGMIPLEIRDNLIGILAYEGTAAPLQQEILSIFSRQAALTIENASLFAKVEEMALKDTLTGLYNRRYFQQILDYELNRSKRYRQPLSLIFIDLDHFKEVNDGFGHSMGDLFLKQIAAKLQSLFRTTDLLARYAGDEFVAVLPATPREGAMILARRLQEVLGSYQVMARGRTLQVSVSIGLDTYEFEEGVGSATLIDRADKAMYEAKASGRNCVRSFQEAHRAAV